MGTPINFKGSNMYLGVCEEHKKQGVVGMPAAHIQYKDGVEAVLECWKLNWIERLAALLFGKVWVSLWVSTDHVPPISVFSTKNVIFKEPKEG